MWWDLKLDFVICKSKYNFNKLLIVISSTSGTEEVFSTLNLDHHQISTTWNRALAFAVRTSPVQQFGIGFGVGW